MRERSAKAPYTFIQEAEVERSRVFSPSQNKMKYTKKQSEYINKIMSGKIPNAIEDAMVDTELNKNVFMNKRNAQDKVEGIIYCWNCGAAMQKPKWISKVKSKNNKFNMKCRCGKSTEVKF